MIMACDCGTTTGIVILDKGEISCFEISGDCFWPKNEFLIVSWICAAVLEKTVGEGGRNKTVSSDGVVLEDFSLRVGTASHKRETLSSPRIAFGVYSRLYSLGFERVFWQSPSDALGVFTDSRLRDLGLWVVGSDHCRDAMRHLLLHCRRTGISLEVEKVKKVKKEKLKN